MTILDLDCIDIFGTLPDGTPLLVIVDVGDLPPVKRLEAYQAKLQLYKSIIDSSTFRAENPNWRKSKIRLTTLQEPTEEMKNIESIRLDEETIEIPIEWDLTSSSLS